MPSFHPDDVLIADYAAGQLDQATALVVAAHVEQCHECAKKTGVYTALSAQFLEEDTLDIFDNDGLEKIMACLPLQQKLVTVKSSIYPHVLENFMAQNSVASSWQKLGSSVEQLAITTGFNGAFCRLMRVKAGKKLPKHSHLGEEFVLVLQGGLSDHRGTLKTGDFIASDSTIVHTPIAAKDEDCVCLVVTHGDLKFKGAFGAVLNILQ